MARFFRSADRNNRRPAKSRQIKSPQCHRPFAHAGAVAVISGYNQRAVVALCRTLRRVDARFAIIGLPNREPMQRSSYRDNILSVRRSVELNLQDILRCLSEARARLGARHVLLAPSTEAWNVFLLQHRDAFESEGYVIPLVDYTLYSKISDKEKFGHLCREFDLPTPRWEPFPSSQQKIAFPVVAKPRTELTPEGRRNYPWLLFTPEDEAAFRAACEPRHFFMQEYIDGASYYLLFYFSRVGRLWKYSQRNLVQQCAGKSIVAAVSSELHLDAVSDRYEAMLRQVGFRGLLMVELKRRGDEWIMIEANPRMWGPSQLFVDAKYDMFQAMLCDYLGLEVLPQTPPHKNGKPTYYCWFGGWLASRKNREQMAYYASATELQSIKRSLLCRDVYLRPDTWKMFFGEMLSIMTAKRNTHERQSR